MQQRANNQKPILNNIFFNVTRVSISILFPLMIFPYASRILGPINLGRIDFSTSVVNYFILFSSLGIPSYGIIACSKVSRNQYELQKTVSELMLLNIFFVVISFLLLLLSIIIIPKFRDYKSLLLLNSVSILFNSIGIEWFYQATEEYRYITTRSIVIKTIVLITVFIFVTKAEDYFIYAVIIVCSSAISNLINFIHARNSIRIYKFSQLRIKRHLIPILTFFAATVAGTINANIDSVMLGFVKGDYYVGLYSFSVKIKLLLIQIITAALTVFIPRLSGYAGAKEMDSFRKTVRKVFLVTSFVSFPLVAFVCFFVGPIIMILGGDRYLQSEVPMIILTVSSCIVSFNYIFGVAILQTVGDEKKYSYVMWIASLVNVSLNAILIPKYDVVGASIATLITEISNCILFYLFSKKYSNNCFAGCRILIFLFLSVISSFVVYYLRKLYSIVFVSSFTDLIISFILFAFIYLLGAFILNGEIRFILVNQVTVLKARFKNAVHRK